MHRSICFLTVDMGIIRTSYTENSLQLPVKRETAVFHNTQQSLCQRTKEI